MTPVGRALIGAAMGALATLVAHPTSRASYLFAFDQNKADAIQSLLPAHQQRMPEPDSLTAASVWAQVGAEKLETTDGLRPEERASLIAVMDAAAAKEPQNAFWSQMRAAAGSNADRNGVAAWRRSAVAAGWNDYQTERLLALRNQLARRSGATQSWQLAYVFEVRSLSSSRLIERFARAQISRSDFYSAPGIGARYIAVQNGNLLRKGAKSLQQGEIGARIVDLAAYPPEMAGVSRPKRLYLGRNVVVNSLRSVGREQAANQALRYFRENDAWMAMTQRQDAVEIRRWLAMSSLLVAGVPGSLLATALIGLALWGISFMITPTLKRREPPVWLITACALFAGVGIGYWSDAWYAGVALTACIGFLAVGPRHVRKTEIEYLGPFFGFMTALLALLLAAGVVLALIIGASATQATVGNMNTPIDEMTPKSLLSAMALIYGMLGIIAPVWALVHRLPTANVFAFAFRRVAVALFAVGLFGTVVSAPVCIWIDQQLETTWSKLVANEPVYYLQ